VGCVANTQGFGERKTHPSGVARNSALFRVPVGVAIVVAPRSIVRRFAEMRMCRA
jgi:hypothetical protein